MRTAMELLAFRNRWPCGSFQMRKSWNRWKQKFELIYSAAKTVKPSTAVMTSSATSNRHRSYWTPRANDRKCRRTFKDVALIELLQCVGLSRDGASTIAEIHI